MLVGLGKAQETIDLVAHVAEAARLIAVAVNGETLSANGLLHEIRYDAAIVELHARAVGIKDADDVSIDFVVAAVRYGGGFGEALGFIVDGARTNRVHVSPIGLFLRMLQRIAIAFRSRGNKVFRTVLAGNLKSVECAQ